MVIRSSNNNCRKVANKKNTSTNESLEKLHELDNGAYRVYARLPYRRMSPQVTFHIVPLHRVVGFVDRMPNSFPATIQDEFLWQAVQRFGVLVPPLVRSLGDGRFRIIDGHRRFLAAKKVGMRSMACAIYEAVAADSDDCLRHLLTETTRLSTVDRKH